MEQKDKPPLPESAVIGHGVVGKATAKAFGVKDYFDLKEKTLSLEELAKKRFIFISLPTPTKNFQCDASLIRNYVKELARLKFTGLIIIRSTIIPGTTAKLRRIYDKIIHFPEFLTEKTAAKDALNPDIVVLGADFVDKNLDVLKKFIKKRFPKSKIFLVSSKTAEMTKYAVNVFYATKVIFANQIYDLCQKEKIPYSQIREIMYSRKWIGKNHLTVWYRGKRGVRGKCLPKDLKAFVGYTRLPFFSMVNKINESYLK